MHQHLGYRLAKCIVHWHLHRLPGTWLAGTRPYPTLIAPVCPQELEIAVHAHRLGQWSRLMDALRLVPAQYALRTRDSATDLLTRLLELLEALPSLHSKRP
jgi:hypothetical protein